MGKIHWDFGCASTELHGFGTYSEVFVPVVTLAVMHPLGGRSNEAFHFHTPLQLQVVASDSCPSTRSKSDLCGYGPAEAGMAPIDKYG